MRIFLQDVPSVTVRIDETNPDIIINTRKITEIYSLNGIYECENERIRRKEITDIPSELTTFKGRNLIIDKSVINIITLFQILMQIILYHHSKNAILLYAETLGLHLLLKK